MSYCISVHTCNVHTCKVCIIVFVQVIGPLGKGETFEVADFKLLEDFERMTHADVVYAKVHIYKKHCISTKMCNLVIRLLY